MHTDWLTSTHVSDRTRWPPNRTLSFRTSANISVKDHLHTSAAVLPEWCWIQNVSFVQNSRWAQMCHWPKSRVIPYSFKCELSLLKSLELFQSSVPGGVFDVSQSSGIVQRCHMYAHVHMSHITQYSGREPNYAHDTVIHPNTTQPNTWVLFELLFYDHWFFFPNVPGCKWYVTWLHLRQFSLLSTTRNQQFLGWLNYSCYTQNKQKAAWLLLLLFLKQNNLSLPQYGNSGGPLVNLVRDVYFQAMIKSKFNFLMFESEF